jgi:hypothetical protein
MVMVKVVWRQDGSHMTAYRAQSSNQSRVSDNVTTSSPASGRTEQEVVGNGEVV